MGICGYLEYCFEPNTALCPCLLDLFDCKEYTSGKIFDLEFCHKFLNKAFQQVGPPIVGLE